jgi:hypothetical protein
MELGTLSKGHSKSGSPLDLHKSGCLGALNYFLRPLHFNLAELLPYTAAACLKDQSSQSTESHTKVTNPTMDW